jgi:hypothetical protein
MLCSILTEQTWPCKVRVRAYSAVGNTRLHSCAQEAERVQRMDTKLKSLHLDGLVDCDDKAAR